MPIIPDGLPPAIKAHSERLIASGGLNSLEPLLLRLVTHLEMQKVWNTLSKKTSEPQDLIDFLEYVRLHPILNSTLNNPIKTPTDKVLRKYFRTISEVSQSTLKVLQDLAKSGSADEGWAILESTLKRAELHEVQQSTKDVYWEIKSIQSDLAIIQAELSVASILNTIARAAYYAAQAPGSSLPKRRQSERVKYNQLALSLKRYLKHHLSTQSPTIIAAVVNAAFDLYDDGLAADDVRKLKT